MDEVQEITRHSEDSGRRGGGVKKGVFWKRGEGGMKGVGGKRGEGRDGVFWKKDGSWKRFGEKD